MTALTHSLSQGGTDVPLIEQTPGRLLRRHGGAPACAPALVSKHQGLRYSYRELQTASNQLAARCWTWAWCRATASASGRTTTQWVLMNWPRPRSA